MFYDNTKELEHIAELEEQLADAQRALDAEREKVAFLEKKNANLIEASNLVLKVKAEQDEQLATLQAQLRQVEGERNDEKTAYKKLSERWNKDSLDLQAKDAEIAALKEHQKLHDRIFERQKLLLSHYAGTIKEAAKRLRYSTHSIEQPEPYNSRTPIVAAFLEQALGVNAEELEKERDTLTHTNARLREAFTKTTKGKFILNRYEHGGGRMFVDDGKNRDLIADTYNEGDREFIARCYETFAQHALADTEGKEGA